MVDGKRLSQATNGYPPPATRTPPPLPPHHSSSPPHPTLPHHYAPNSPSSPSPPYKQIILRQRKHARKFTPTHTNTTNTLPLPRPPNHPTWVHENTHGMARRDSTPPVGLLLAGLDPMLRAPSSSSGVAVLKYGTKRGSFLTMPRYAW